MSINLIKILTITLLKIYIVLLLIFFKYTFLPYITFLLSLYDIHKHYCLIGNNKNIVLIFVLLILSTLTKVYSKCNI